MSIPSASSVPPVTMRPLHRPESGSVADPSPLESPPTVSSHQDVNVTGAAAVPATTNDPLTDRALLLLPETGTIFTVVPAATVNVTPAGTDNPPASTTHISPVVGTVP